MAELLRIALAQLNPTVGDVDGNVARIRAARRQAAAAGADLVVCSELTVSGYPPDDLVMKGAFLERCRTAVESLAADTGDGGPALLIGAPLVIDGARSNCAALLDGGVIAAIRRKHLLPNYGVFDERRLFEPGPAPGPMVFRGVRLGVLVCEDMWRPDVAETLAETGAELLVAINGSPYEEQKADERLSIAVARVVETGLPLAYVNQVGGQDELVFDGGSFVLNADRSPAIQAPAFSEELIVTEWRRGSDGAWVCAPQPLAPEMGRLEQLHRAMVVGLRDYVLKNGFPGVVLGLSGGIDSALAAAIAVDGLGADKVWTVMLPSPYTSAESFEDAAATAALLGARHDVLPINPAMQAYDAMLAPIFAGRGADVTEENLQSRARGVVLMAISNKFGPMVLSTGNKSEMSTGYATLYGDMCGGYAVLKDIYKTDVFALTVWRNHLTAEQLRGLKGPAGAVTPQRVIDKPPSAELRPDQKDEDSLPPYAVLDALLAGLIEGELSVEQMIAAGFEPALVRRVWRMLDRAEYKRRQAPPGPKLTRRAFGRERRYPITNGFTALIAP